jgi:trimeric autotransporter adhesin
MVRAPLFFLTFLSIAGAQPYVISTVAGGAPPLTPAAATGVAIGDPPRVAADARGNVYFAGLHTIFRVDPAGSITRIAGTGRAGMTGDGGSAFNAQVDQPLGLAVDDVGNLFFSERDANLIRKVSAAGIITRYAGTGSAGYLGDGGDAASAMLNGPMGLALDAAGDLYVADTGNHAVRKISPAGVIGTVAGVGYPGFGGDGAAATEAHLNNPEGVALDAAGNLYIADTFNNRVRQVKPDGTMVTFAANGYPGFSGDDGPATAATLFFPTDVAVDRKGSVYIADLGNIRIRKVTEGAITTFAGTSRGTLVDGEFAAAVRLNGASGIAVDPSGAVFFTQGSIGSGSGLQVGDRRVWKIGTDMRVIAVAGNGLNSFSGDYDPATRAQLDQPTGMALDGAGNLYFADTRNHRVRKISPNGIVVTVAGNAIGGFFGDGGQATVALLQSPTGVAVDAAGNLFIADTGNHRVREVFPNGIIGTVAGNGNAAFFGDGGSALNASLNSPRAIALDADGNLYIADTKNHRIRKVNGSGIIDSVAGRGMGVAGDGGPATGALLNFPAGVALDSSGNLYIADQGNGRVRVVGNDGFIRTLAGADTPIDAAGVALDEAGGLYVTDSANRRVFRVAADGARTLLAGTGQCCYEGDGGPAASARLNHPWGIAVEPGGGVYVSDSGNNAIRYLYRGAGNAFIRLIANGASNLPGAVAPGEVVTIFGSGLGPAQLVLGENSPAAVDFDGIAAPLLYASDTQISAIVPYGVKGGSLTVTVRYNGQTAVSTAALASTAPALFAADASGAGQARALNQDGSVNSAARPAPAGSTITLYATGEGQTSPAGVDGKPVGDPAPLPLVPVEVRIGGQMANVKYAGGIPGVVAGVMRVEVEIPSGITAGNAVPVVLIVGGVASPPVTIAVGN